MRGIDIEMASTLLLAGDMAEVGVFQGLSAQCIHRTAPHKTLHLYDTFKGIVKADKSIDVHSDGDFANTSVEQARDCVGGGDLVKFHVGVFPDTFTEWDVKFCFVYSDTDTYFGTKATLDVFASRMVPEGKVMFDDYGWKACPGVQKAISEFLADKSHLRTSRNDTQFIIKF